MVSLFDRLLRDGLTQHSAWRAAFAIVPVPILLFTAALVLIFGTDCPAGKWSERHTLRATAVSVAHGHELVIDSNEEIVLFEKGQDTEKDANAITEVKIRNVDRVDQAIKPEEEKRENHFCLSSSK
jgi:NNP family nitrate/nitrite transporter-like MFS transporter